MLTEEMGRLTGKKRLLGYSLGESSEREHCLGHDMHQSGTFEPVQRRIHLVLARVQHRADRVRCIGQVPCKCFERRHGGNRFSGDERESLDRCKTDPEAGERSGADRNSIAIHIVYREARVLKHPIHRGHKAL